MTEETGMQRLDKILSDAGVASRKQLKAMIRAGRVTADGKCVSDEAAKFDENAVALTVDGEPVKKYRTVLLVMNKPAGLVTATEDPRQPTVMELVPEEYRKLGVAPVGRLDKDTEGLLLLTNDGELNHRLCSPKYAIDKVYEAVVEGVLTEADRTAFAEGIVLKEFTCLPAKLEILAENRCLVTVQEGKYHQVKRMLQSRGKPVTFLKRLSVGPIKLPVDLTKGDYRPLTEEEVKTLRLMCHL